MAIVPVPTTRVGDYFVRQRLVSQVQADQLSLFQLQNQVSTGRRILRPSDDAAAALRAMNVQRVLLRKEQVQTNLTNSEAVLGAADSSLATVSNQLSDIRAAALGVADTISTDSDRQAVIHLIDAALEALVATANTNFKGRYLFAGSRTDTLPFGSHNEFIEYLGNEKELQNYVDLGQLFSTNIPGTEIFGGRSGEVRGTADLDPQLTANTLLSSINGGAGLGPNAAITVSVTEPSGTTSRVVDLSGAVTIGDVARLIEENPPAGGADVTVDIAANGLTIRTDTGTIRVGEVASGRSARELGIFTPAGAPASDTIVGTDLDPAVEKTTPLENLLGRKATGRIVSAGASNDLVLTANQNGTALNGVDVVYVNDVTAGNETATYAAGVLTVHIQAGVTTANQVADAINTEGTFTAVADYRDAATVSAAGTAAVLDDTFTDVTADGAGTSLDLGDGIILTNGDETVTLDLGTAETVEDLLNLINGAGVGMIGDINAAGTGIDVRSVWSGADFTIGEDGGQTATQLGIRTYTGSTRLSDLNRGVGVTTHDLQYDTFTPITTADLALTARDGTAITVDLDSATTLADVVNLINTAPGNQVGTTSVTASLTADGNGIALVDSSTPITGDLIVQGNAASEALGFLNVGAASISDNTVDVDGNYSLNSYRSSFEDDLVVVARDGTELSIDLTGASTVQDVIDRINSHVRNNANGTAVLAQLAANGNGIELVDSSATTTGALTVRSGELSQAAEGLGFVADGQTQASSTSGSGGTYSLTSEDRNTLEVDSVFNSLIRLRSALSAADVPAIGTAIDRLDTDLTRVNFARAEIGSRLQGLDVIQTRLEDENVQLQSALSNDLDVDLVEAISSLTAKQYALQASLQTAANILNLSLLDYI
jgi:flagellar hook-associated protein 3 FlgL